MKITTTPIVDEFDNGHADWEDVQRVVIDLGDGRTITVYELADAVNAVQVRTNSQYDDEMVIRPRYSNTIEIALVPR